MSENKQFLLVYVKDARPGRVIEGLQAGLRERGAGIREITLGDDYEQLLDEIEAGAVPLVIRETL